jgi:hypothetical protein
MPGNRDAKAQYTYSDLFRSYFLLTLCGGECAENITRHSRRELSRMKGFDVCSAETQLRMQKELATEIACGHESGGIRSKHCRSCRFTIFGEKRRNRR